MPGILQCPTINPGLTPHGTTSTVVFLRRDEPPNLIEPDGSPLFRKNRTGGVEKWLL